MSEPMIIWTVYERPLDFPGVPFVVRGWQVGDGGQMISVGMAMADSLDEARARIPIAAGLVRFERDASDDPHIVESWL